MLVSICVAVAQQAWVLRLHIRRVLRLSSQPGNACRVGNVRQQHPNWLVFAGATHPCASCLIIFYRAGRMFVWLPAPLFLHRPLGEFALQGAAMHVQCPCGGGDVAVMLAQYLL